MSQEAPGTDREGASADIGHFSWVERVGVEVALRNTCAPAPLCPTSDALSERSELSKNCRRQTKDFVAKLVQANNNRRSLVYSHIHVRAHIRSFVARAINCRWPSKLGEVCLCVSVGLVGCVHRSIETI